MEKWGTWLLAPAARKPQSTFFYKAKIGWGYLSSSKLRCLGQVIRFCQVYCEKKCFVYVEKCFAILHRFLYIQIMQKKILVQIKNVYGNDLVYPVCDDAKLFAELIDKKTFSKHDLANIKRLGYTIDYSATFNHVQA